MCLPCRALQLVVDALVVVLCCPCRYIVLVLLSRRCAVCASPTNVIPNLESQYACFQVLLWLPCNSH